MGLSTFRLRRILRYVVVGIVSIIIVIFASLRLNSCGVRPVLADVYLRDRGTQIDDINIIDTEVTDLGKIDIMGIPISMKLQEVMCTVEEFIENKQSDLYHDVVGDYFGYRLNRLSGSRMDFECAISLPAMKKTLILSGQFDAEDVINVIKGDSYSTMPPADIIVPVYHGVPEVATLRKGNLSLVYYKTAELPCSVSDYYIKSIDNYRANSAMQFSDIEENCNFISGNIEGENIQVIVFDNLDNTEILYLEYKPGENGGI